MDMATTSLQVPSIQWIEERLRRSRRRHNNRIGGYNIFTMVYSDTYGGSPPKGLYGTYDQKPWQDIAIAYNKYEELKKEERRKLYEDILNMCISMHNLDLPPYVILEIIDQWPNSQYMTRYEKITLIEKVRDSCRKKKRS